jgi:hypothetical protein
MTDLIVDVEASGLENGYPIEVAIADCKAGIVRAWLIRPASTWESYLDWSPASEKVHGLTHRLITQSGQDAGVVAAEIAAFAAGRPLLSDNPAFDRGWLAILFEAATRSRMMPSFAEDSVVTELSYLAAARRRSAYDIDAINRARLTAADHSAAGDAASWAAAAEALACDSEISLDQIDAIFTRWSAAAQRAAEWRSP